MADVAKPEQTTEANASVDAKEPEKVSENNATPPETEKAQEKTESPSKEHTKALLKQFLDITYNVFISCILI